MVIQKMGLEIFISVVVLLLGIAILVLFHAYIQKRAFRANNITNNGVPTSINIQERSFAGGGGSSRIMSQEDIKKLPCFDFNVVDDQELGGEENSSSLDCAVCLENFKVGDKCRLLPKCNHSFHSECIDSWLLKTGFCPICRDVVVVVNNHLPPSEILEQN